MFTRAVAVAATIALAAPAVAAGQSVTEVKYWFHCGGPSKVQNVASLSGGATWNRTAPTKSFAPPDAAGCGFVDPPGSRTETHNAYDAVFSGVHAGAIGAVNIELHNLVTSRARQGETVVLNVRITALGSATPLVSQDVTVRPELSSTGASERMVLRLDDLAIPAGAANRTLTIAIDTKGPQPQAWVFDAVEVPAHVSFIEPFPPLTLGWPNGVEKTSLCDAGTRVAGLSVEANSRGYVSHVATICRDAEGAETTANSIGPESFFVGEVSRCADDDVANGIAGRVGDIIDAVGIGCEVADGAVVGGDGGKSRAVDCGAGARLVGLRGTYAHYFGLDTITSLTAVCE